jgi:hypothetical protein
MVLPSGAQAILMFSPLVEMVAAAFDDLDSQIRTCLKKGKNGFLLVLILISQLRKFDRMQNCEPSGA